MQTKPTLAHTLTVAFLIAGNLVGAGILALPIKTGLAGFIPSVIAMIAVSACMYYSAVVLSTEAIREKEPTFNYPSIYHAYMGMTGKWLAIVANLLILYGLLVAYLAGATSIITNVFHVPVPSWVVLTIFFLLITFLNLREAGLMRKYNTLFMFLLWVSFAVIVIMSEPRVEQSRLMYMDWGFLPCTIPIVLTSFHFHNIIPHVCHHLKWHRKIIFTTMLIGMLLAFVMNLLWMQVGSGALPLTGKISLLNAFQLDLPSTIPLAKLVANPLFTTFTLLFALLAISTSYLANGMGLLGFFEDLANNHFNIPHKWLPPVLAFIPPYIVALVYPNIFLKALNVVGGIGIAVLFGILPCTIAYKRAKHRYRKVIAVVMLVVFTTFLLFEIAQETGMLDIKPYVEYWKHNM